eukprot:TRINITY_DN14354_c0_g1_i2.p1 TRINITY_DN14354_c0_g1~~TRINITY_DN14354_c0_g1_i2.p1  ORF type:complete len:134 (-),score=33.89 TRINITY_DN14354_c0_g1_i2:271-672(-)
MSLVGLLFFFFQAEDGIRDAQESRGLGDVYKRQEKMVMGRKDIADAIGAPYRRAFWWEGNVNEPLGRARVELTLNGTRGSGTVSALVARHKTKWETLMLDFTYVDEKNITRSMDLLNDTVQVHASTTVASSLD